MSKSGTKLKVLLVPHPQYHKTTFYFHVQAQPIPAPPICVPVCLPFHRYSAHSNIHLIIKLYIYLSLQPNMDLPQKNQSPIKTMMIH